MEERMNENRDMNREDMAEERYESAGGQTRNGRNSGFGKGFAGGFLMCLLLVTVVMAGITVGKRIALKKQQEQLPGQNIQSGTQTPSGENNQTNQSQQNNQTGQAQQGGQTGVDGLLTEEFLAEIRTIYEEINLYYLYDYSNEELQTGMLRGMLAALGDPYSVYYDASDLDSFNSQTTGEYYGIGCSVSQNLITGVITIVIPYEGAPAYEAGVRAGDILYAVNDELVTGMDLDKVVTMIKGAEGSTVKLTMVRDGETDYLEFQVERRKVVIPTVEYEMLEDKIGYIAVSAFEGVTTKQFIQAYEDLEDQGMEGLIIDMRNNGGGLLTTVEDMLDYLLPAGEIFYAKDKYNNKYLEYSSDAQAALDVPLVVLINGNTASAAEVFSGNVQAFGMATLVGTNTYGKGIMQNLFVTTPEKDCAIKLTTADYYIHGDRNIHQIGIAPDIEVELEYPAEGEAMDNQLQTALQTVKDLMK